MEHIRVGIVGNIGVGKSTFVETTTIKKYKDMLLDTIPDKTGEEKIHVFKEEFNPQVLDEFYENPIENAFMAQIEFFNGRLERQLKIHNCKGIVFEDRTLAEDYYIFGMAQKILGNMTNGEFLTYQKTFNLMTKKIPEPDLIVYLRADVDTLKRRISLRGRESENLIDDKYLELLNSLYEEFISRHVQCPVLIIDSSLHHDLDEFRDYSMQKLAEKIKELNIRVTTPGISKWVTLPQTQATLKAIEAESKLETYLKENPKLITIAGNVGLGKSTLTAIMERSLKIEGLYESPEKKPLLEKFLGNKPKYCYDLQLHFLRMRKEMQTYGKKQNKSFVMDRSIPEDLLVFCQQFQQDGLLTQNELDNLKTLFRATLQEIPREDLLIVLKGSTDIAWERINQRGREMEIEGGWSRSDIHALNKWYKTYSSDVKKFGYYVGPILEIDVEKLDITNRIHVGYIFEEIYNLLTERKDFNI